MPYGGLFVAKAFPSRLRRVGAGVGLAWVPREADNPSCIELQTASRDADQSIYKDHNRSGLFD